MSIRGGCSVYQWGEKSSSVYGTTSKGALYVAMTMFNCSSKTLTWLFQCSKAIILKRKQFSPKSFANGESVLSSIPYILFRFMEMPCHFSELDENVFHDKLTTLRLNVLTTHTKRVSSWIRESGYTSEQLAPIIILPRNKTKREQQWICPS